ncbi:MAG: hypothetical protein IJ458_01740 [Clostridia bacterium]|nr:hypothetical protein [Clostridia bacterium]
MENEDKRPEVWVARRLNRKMCGCMGVTIAYFASKARVQNVTRRFLKNGKEVKEYEVEYETPQALEEISYGSDMYAETGDYVKYNKVFRNYESCRECVDNLNNELMTQDIKNAERSGMITKQEVQKEHCEDMMFVRKLENYFDKVNHTDSRDNLKIF